MNRQRLAVSVRLIMIFVLVMMFDIRTSSSQDGIQFREIMRLGRGTAESLDWQPDGKLLAVGGSAGVWLFDADYQQTLHQPAFPARRVKFSPDGQYLAVSDGDATTEFWRLSDDGELLERSAQIPVSGYGLRWSPDGQHISMVQTVLRGGVGESHAEVWNTIRGELVLTISDIANFVDVAWSPDGLYLAGANRDGEIVVWNVADGEAIQSLQIPEDLYEVSGVAFSHNGQGLYLVFTGSDALWSWEFDRGKLVATDIEMPFLDTALGGLERQPDGDFLTTESIGGGGANGGIYAFDMENELTFIAYNDYIADFSWVPGTNRLSVLTGNGMVREVDVLTDDSVNHQLFMPPGSISWSPDSRWLLQTTGWNPSNFSYPVIAWDVSEVAPKNHTPDRVMYPSLAAKWSRWLPDSQHVMVFSDNSVPNALCLVYYVEDWDILQDTTTFLWENGICGLQNMPDLSGLNWDYVGDWTDDFGLVAAAYGNTVEVAVATSYNDPITTLETEARVTSVAWSPDADHLLTVSVNEDTGQAFIEVWDPSSENRLARFAAPAPVFSAIWSPDSRSISVLAGADEDYALRVLEASNGEPRFERTFPSTARVQWKPDGSQLAVSQARDGASAIDIVDSQSGEPLFSMALEQITGFNWHPSQDWLAVSTGSELLIYDIAEGVVAASAVSEGSVLDWSPDGTMLAVGGSDGIIRVWQIISE